MEVFWWVGVVIFSVILWVIIVGHLNKGKGDK